MTAADRRELEERDEDSDVLVHATFMAHPRTPREEVHHLVGVRYRGGETRFLRQKSYRVELHSERRFETIRHLNLNGTAAPEILAADFFRRAGIGSPQEWMVNFTLNGEPNARYVRKEHMDENFLTRWYGERSDEGNFYRALDPDDDDAFPLQGDLRYLGNDPDEYRPYYRKRNNEEADDYSDVIELARIFDPVETPDDVFPDRLERVAAVSQWARFFAAQSCVANIDGSIQNETGEDYSLYRVPADSGRSDASKWVILPWDIEETFEHGEERDKLFRTILPSFRRFLTHPRFAPLYYCHLIHLRDGVFSQAELSQRFSLIDFEYGLETTEAIDAFIALRHAYFDEEIPMGITATAGPGPDEVVIDVGDRWRYFKGTKEPSDRTRAWTGIGFDHSSWDVGPSGFGYGDADDATTLAEMEDAFSSLYIRKEFEIIDPGAIDRLVLKIDYDDGFVAYLNGFEVVRRNLGDPDRFVRYSLLADEFLEAGEPEELDLSEHTDVLVAGTNVLAIQGANESLDSSDFSLIPRLEAAGVATGSRGCGEVVRTATETVQLVGTSNACSTRSVEVDGLPADYDPVTASWSIGLPVEPGENRVTIRAFDQAGRLFDSAEILVERLEGSSECREDGPG